MSEVKYDLDFPGCRATGTGMLRGFKVLKGSLVRSTAVPSMRDHARSHYEVRERLIRNGTLVPALGPSDQYQFTRDHTFDSVTQATNVCTGKRAQNTRVWVART